MKNLGKAVLLFAMMMLSLTLQAIHVVACMEIDMISTVMSVHDGDTFTLVTGERVRLADLNAPELGEDGSYEARDYLSSLVRQKTVYLGIDDKYRTDAYGRLVCVVYVDYNSTHYLNVNKALIEGSHAGARDYDNEFKPGAFVLFIPKDPDLPVVGSSQSYAVAAIAFAVFIIALLIMAIRRR